MMYDVIVVGGGPTGLSSSISLLSNDLDVLILEEHKEVGIPRHCTGVVSESLIKLVGYPAEASIINRINKANFKSPSGYTFELSFEKYTNFILDRILFERNLLREFEKKGGNILYNKKVKKIEILNDKVAVKFDGNTLYTKFVFIASGTNVKLIDGYKPPNSFPSIQYEIEDSVENKNEVELIFTKEAKGFFLWKAPTSDNSYLIGLGRKDIYSKYYLDSFLKKNNIKGKIKAVYSGRIIFDKPLSRPYFKNAVLVGDAAGHSKATTGGGLFYGILGSKIAAEIVSKYLAKELPVNYVELEYMERKHVISYLNNTYTLAKYFYALSDKQYDILIKALSKIQSKISINPDYQDYHHTYIIDFILNPKLAVQFIKSFIS